MSLYLNFESREQTLLKIMKSLEPPRTKRLVVYGLGGVGKTTLVKHVGAYAARVKLFSGVVMATLAHSGAAEGARRQLEKALGITLEDGFGRAERADRMARMLHEGNFLVILDDVVKMGQELDLLIEHMGIPYGCTILLATSFFSDASYDESLYASFQLTLIRDGEAGMLFDEIINNAGGIDPDLDAIGKQVAVICHGLPVLIVTIAAALSKRASLSEWKDALNQLQELKNIELQEFVTSAVELICYNYLQDQHKSLFLLCALLMRNGDQISISDLRLEWLKSLQVMEGGPSLDCLVIDLESSYLLLQGEDSSYVKMHDVICSAAIEIAHKAQDVIWSASRFGWRAKESIGVLEEEEAWRLFKNTIGNDAGHGDLEVIGKQVVKRCKGLPVLIVTIAAALSKRPTVSAREDALVQLERTKNMELHEFVNSAVESICYKHLHHLHKSLFLLCALLENVNGDQIAISDLRSEWLQLEGMGGRASLESLIVDLKASYLLLQGENSNYVRMHDLVRYAAIEIAYKARDAIQCVGESSSTKAIKVQDVIQYAAGGSVLGHPSLSRLLERVIQDSEMKYCTLLKELKALKRMNDLVSLISSYPMLIVTGKMHERWKTWTSLFSQLNSVRKEQLEDVLRHHPRRTVENVRSEISRGSSQIMPILEDILSYLPLDMIEDLPELKALVELRAQMEATQSRTHGHEYEESREEEPMPRLVLEFAIESAIHHITTSIKIVDWIGISGEGRHEVVQALKKDMAEKFENVFLVSVTEDWSGRIGRIEGGITNKSSSLYLIDLHESVDVSEWIQGCRMWNMLRDRKVVFITTSPISFLPVDLQIRMEDHLLPWKLFCKNAGNIVHSSVPIRKLAADLVKCCGGNLTATIIVARALRDASDVNVWKEAQSMLSASEFNRRNILANAVRLVSRKRRWSVITKHCLLESLSDWQWVERKSLITLWRSNGLTHSDGQGLEILNDLVEAFLFEYSSGNPELIRVTPDLHDVMASIFKPGQLVIRGKVPTSEEWDCVELDCSGTDLSELPENPSCYALQKLILQDNRALTGIPSRFFESMEVLEVLNMSNTSIKKLPESFFKLTNLTELVLRGCRLFMELPRQIGKLLTLKVLDLEGTEIIGLPPDVQNLINLTCLKVSFYGYGELPKTMIPAGVLTKLCELIELSIDVNPDDERWEVDVTIAIKEVVTLQKLRYVKLYLPEMEHLYYLRKHFPSLIVSPYRRFNVTVGSHFRRMMSWTPLGVEDEFEKQRKCLRYVHGSEAPATQLRYALQFTKAFFLDRHHTVTKLSQFGTDNMKQLELCVLGECSELETIIEEGSHSRRGDYEEYSNEEEGSDEEEYIDEEEYSDEEDDSSILTVEPVLESLEHLIVYNMEKLRSIWVSKVSIHKASFSRLKSLRLHSCPRLNTIFSVDLVGNLDMLEEIIVEDCASIQKLVEPHPQSSNLQYMPLLRNLKKITLHYLPELVSISSGLHIAPKLEKMSFYDCPNLKSLSDKEVSSKHLEKIRGEEEWWNGLEWKEAEWKEGRPDNLAYIFIPFKEDEDLMTQLAEDEKSAQVSGTNTKPNPQPGTCNSVS